MQTKQLLCSFFFFFSCIFFGPKISRSFAQPWARPATLNHSPLSGAQTSPPAKEGSGSSSAGRGRLRSQLGSRGVHYTSSHFAAARRSLFCSAAAWRSGEERGYTSQTGSMWETQKSPSEYWKDESGRVVEKKTERAIYCKPIISSHLLGSRHLSFSLFPFSVSDRSVNLLKMKHFLSPLLQRNGRFISSIRPNFAEPRQSLRRILSSQQRSRGKSLCAVVKNRTFTHCFSRFHIITLTFIELRHFFWRLEKGESAFTRVCDSLASPNCCPL